MLQHRKGSKTYQKGYSQFYHRDPSKEIISLNSCSIECNSWAKAEYICINVLYPFHLCFLRRNCLWFVTLLVRKKKMLNRCFPYQQSLQIPSTFHPVLIKSSPGHKRANTLIRQGSGKKNKPHREGTFSSPLLLWLPQPTEGGDERSRRTYKCGDEEQLVKMVDDKHKAPCGWKN